MIGRPVSIETLRSAEDRNTLSPLI